MICNECGRDMGRDYADYLCPPCAKAQPRSEAWQRTYDDVRQQHYRRRTCDGHSFRSESRPLRSAYARGYADAKHGHDRIAPYEQRSHHGGTWGYQLCRAYYEGFDYMNR